MKISVESGISLNKQRCFILREPQVTAVISPSDTKRIDRGLACLRRSDHLPRPGTAVVLTRSQMLLGKVAWLAAGSPALVEPRTRGFSGWGCESR